MFPYCIAFEACAQDKACAERTVRLYMNEYAQVVIQFILKIIFL
jgi:hypothetical protein